VGKLGHLESFIHFHKTFERGREKELEEKKKGFEERRTWRARRG